MEIKRISILNDFKCNGKDCPANCCRNSWKVPIDPAMYTKYRSEKGIWGLLLRLFIALYAEDRETINADEISMVMTVYERRAQQIKN